MRSKLRPDGTIIDKKDYEPFGKELLGNHARLGYIGKGKDKESSLNDHGVRKYDYETGRFMSVDALWEKYIDLNPYQYSGNNPIRYIDENGMFITDNKGNIVTKGSGQNTQITANNGKAFTVSHTQQMNCIGYAFAFCNGKGARIWDYDASLG